MSERKETILKQAAAYVCPNRVAMLGGLGIDLVLGRREGYRIWDIDGKELLDFHLNGGVYSLGHRHAELVAALRGALDTLDIGNHHFPSVQRSALGEALAGFTPGDLQYSVFASGGGEAVDIAIKSARHATGRRTIVSIHKGYHGHTGLALPAGDERFLKLFHSEPAPGDFVQVPFNDLDAMEAALAQHEAAAVLLETLPATYGFPLPDPGYLTGVRELCTRYGAMYIADEVQTGLGRTGARWGVDTYGVQPDILVTGKGLSGGLYPIAAAVLSPKAGAWLHEDGWGHVSTFGGAELGCVVASKVLEMLGRDEVAQHAQRVADTLGAGLDSLQQQYGDWLVEVRRCGLVIGLKFNDDFGGMLMSRALYDHGLWAMFAGLDTSVLQFKPGILLSYEDCALALERMEAAIRQCVSQRA
ncbi:MAG: aminotransferase class III-fold pyridoxal phosphate-dependent enzyme [Candidatus Hydrogenedens sp.]|nr:aminotransferase class III-fold pyridoxal phosphate-dependent enzyme [Candidatus Hydrogenedens sp.]